MFAPGDVVNKGVPDREDLRLFYGARLELPLRINSLRDCVLGGAQGLQGGLLRGGEACPGETLAVPCAGPDILGVAGVVQIGRANLLGR